MTGAEAIALARRRGVALEVFLGKLRFRRDRRGMLSALSATVLLSRRAARLVEPKLVAEITYLTWTADNLLRHTVYVGLREDKPAVDVRREAARAR